MAYTEIYKDRNYFKRLYIAKVSGTQDLESSQTRCVKSGKTHLAVRSKSIDQQQFDTKGHKDEEKQSIIHRGTGE